MCNEVGLAAEVFPTSITFVELFFCMSFLIDHKVWLAAEGLPTWTAFKGFSSHMHLLANKLWLSVGSIPRFITFTVFYANNSLFMFRKEGWFPQCMNVIRILSSIIITETCITFQTLSICDTFMKSLSWSIICSNKTQFSKCSTGIAFCHTSQLALIFLMPFHTTINFPDFV